MAKGAKEGGGRVILSSVRWSMWYALTTKEKKKAALCHFSDAPVSRATPISFFFSPFGSHTSIYLIGECSDLRVDRRSVTWNTGSSYWCSTPPFCQKADNGGAAHLYLYNVVHAMLRTRSCNQLLFLYPDHFPPSVAKRGHSFLLLTH